jgi:hypothetical protein
LGGGRSRKAEIGRADRAATGVADRSVGRAYGGVIEDVEEFGAKFHVEPFQQLRLLEHREIKVPPRGPSVGVTSQVSRLCLHSAKAVHRAGGRGNTEIVARVLNYIVSEELAPMLRVSGSRFDKEGTRAYAVEGVISVLIGTVGPDDGEGEPRLNVIDPQCLPTAAEGRGHKAPAAGNMVGKVSRKTLGDVVTRPRILAADAGRIILCDSTAGTGSRPTPYRIRVGKIFAPSVVGLKVMPCAGEIFRSWTCKAL